MPRLLDLFCCAGGAARGYADAGFEVVGVDVRPQPNYPFEFIQADALSLGPAFVAGLDMIHASPPCQKYSRAQRLRANEHPDLLAPVREKLLASGRLYVIENVPGAYLRRPFMLCGRMFPSLRVYRHRIFEANFPVEVPHHRPHDVPQTKMGRPPVEGHFIQPVGNFSGVGEARQAMGCPWMTQNELREAIPPAYTRFIGEQALAFLNAQRAAA